MPRRPWNLALCFTCALVLASAAPSAQTPAAPDTFRVSGIVRGLSPWGLGGDRALSGATISVGSGEGGEGPRSVTTGPDGRFALDDVPGGEVTFTVEHPRFETESLVVTAAPGRLYTRGMVEQGACPPGESCLLAADAVIELAVEPFERAGDVVLEVVFPDGATAAVAFLPPDPPGSTVMVVVGSLELLAEVRVESGGLLPSRILSVRTATGEPLAEGRLGFTGDGEMPGCSELCSLLPEVAREVRVASSRVGDPTALCEPAACGAGSP